MIIEKNKNAGFTLVELLVVLTILILLISYTINVFGEIKAKGRDTRRLADIDQIRKGLEFFGSGSYPICSSEIVINGVGDCLSSALISGRAMPAVPVDPLGGGSGVCGGVGEHVYCYISQSGISYTLRYATEVNGVLPVGWHTMVY